MNDYPVRDGSQSRLFMRFEKKMRSIQGMAIWQDNAFILYDTGVCFVHDLKEKQAEPTASFKLGSYNDGQPTKDYLNHANHCMFGGIHYNENPIPLLYVTIGAGVGADEDGFFYRLSVENIEQTPQGYQSRVLQTITYQPSDMSGSPYESPCWGCPAFFVDTEANKLYIFSARYRTKKGCVPEGETNAYIITTFELPDLKAGPLVRLTAADIQDQFVVESDVAFTQGGQMTDGIIYYTFGLPAKDYPDRVMAFDVKQKKALFLLDHLDEALNQEEIECCDWYEGQLLCNTNGGALYALDLEGK